MLTTPYKSRLRVYMTLVAILLSSCGNNLMPEQKIWAESVAAPSELEFWVGSGNAVKLPVHKNQFTRIISLLGGHYYIPGEGEARSLSSPPPSVGSPCKMMLRTVVLDFPSDREKETPQYVAYMDEFDMIQCVDKQFSYSG
jgi:hypothetical protein